MSNFLFGPFSFLINFPYKSVRYLELRYLEFSRSLQSFLGCFPSATSNIRIKFSNESYCSLQIFECCLEVCYFIIFFFQHRSGNMSSVKQKLNVKSLGEKCQALRDLEKGPQTKKSLKNMMYRCEAKFY